VIPHLPGWHREELVGGLVVMTAGPAKIRYAERAREVRPLDELVSSIVRIERDFSVTWISRPETLWTDEGETAALVTVEGNVAGVPARIEIAIVFADDFVDLVVGRSTSALVFAELSRAVRTLALGDVLALGVRPRRPIYDGPEAWQCVERGLRADWLNPSFPDDPATISVWPATPDTTIDAKATDAGSAYVVEPVATRHGLVGARWRAELVPGILREVFVIHHGSHTFAVRLDCRRRDADLHRRSLIALVDSLRPFPSARRRAATSAWLSHWVD
jgi:hypothetical protein